MHWSVEYEIVALIVSVLLLANLRSLRILPMKSGRLFVNGIFEQLAVIIFDVIATGMDVYLSGRYIGLQIFFNTAYFLVLAMFFETMHMMLCALSYEKRGLYYQFRAADHIIFAAMILIVVSNLFDGILFTVTSSGYQRGWGYYYIVFPFIALEMLAGIAHVIYSRKCIARRIIYSIYIAIACVVFAVVYQIYIDPGRLLINGGTSIGLVIIYLAMLDSDADNETKTGTYNSTGFRRYMTERLLSSRSFRVYFLQIEGYNSVLAVFGRIKTDRLLWTVGRELIKRYRTTFYLHAGLFAVVETNEKKYDQLEKYISGVVNKTRYIDGERAEISFRTETVTDQCSFTDASEMLAVVSDSIRKQNYDKKPFEVVSKEDVKESEQKKKLNQALYRALQNNGVRVYYQPIFDNVSDKVHSAEALARIYDDEMGLIFPDNFIPLFEKDGTILKFGKLIFENVCRFIRDNDMEALGLEYIEVNLSPIQCMQPSLPDELIAIADDYGVDMKYLNFEITETASLSADLLLHLMTTLIDKGASFSVDDFGTGYSNIIRVSNLPFRIIKIDKSILWDYFKTKDEMVPRIYDMMHCKGFAMVTEGVETEDMHKWLKTEARCQYEQGYLYSKPIDEESFIRYLERVNNKELA